MAHGKASSEAFGPNKYEEISCIISLRQFTHNSLCTGESSVPANEKNTGTIPIQKKGDMKDLKSYYTDELTATVIQNSRKNNFKFNKRHT